MIQPPPPAPTSLHCWLWAAYPWRTPSGDLALDQIAAHLQITAEELQEAITRDTRPDSVVDLRQTYRRAVLRGQGTPLWPDLDEGSAQRESKRLAYALRAHDHIVNDPASVPEGWRKAGHLQPHTVITAWWPQAHVYGASAISATKSLRKIERHAEILDSAQAPNRFAGRIMKGAVLRRAQARCVTPEDLVPVGRTETWRERVVRTVRFEVDGQIYETEMTVDELRRFRASLKPWKQAAKRTQARPAATVGPERVQRGPVRIPTLHQALKELGAIT